MVVKTNGEFTKVACSLSSCAELIGEITAASQEQARGVAQVNTAVAAIDQIVQQAAGSAAESAAASGQLQAQAEEMEGFVAELVALVGTARPPDQRLRPVAGLLARGREAARNFGALLGVAGREKRLT